MDTSLRQLIKKTLIHLFTKYDADLNFEDFISSLNISIQKVNNDTYLKVFDTNIVDTDLKPESFDANFRYKIKFRS